MRQSKYFKVTIASIICIIATIVIGIRTNGFHAKDYIALFFNISLASMIDGVFIVAFIGMNYFWNKFDIAIIKISLILLPYVVCSTILSMFYFLTIYSIFFAFFAIQWVVLLILFYLSALLSGCSTCFIIAVIIEKIINMIFEKRGCINE